MKLLALSVAITIGFFVLARGTEAQHVNKLSDADIARMLVGTWRFEPVLKEPPIRVTMTYTKDQTCSIEAKSDVDYVVKATGTWKVEKCEIVITIKESTIAEMRGKVERVKVASVDESTLKCVGLIKESGPREREPQELLLAFKKVKG